MESTMTVRNLRASTFGLLIFVIFFVVGFLMSILIYGFPNGTHWLSP